MGGGVTHHGISSGIRSFLSGDPACCCPDVLMSVFLSVRAEVEGRTPMGRTGQVEEISGAVAFLCLPPSSYITGQTLAVDGGFTIKGLY